MVTWLVGVGVVSLRGAEASGTGSSAANKSPTLITTPTALA